MLYRGWRMAEKYKTVQAKTVNTQFIFFIPDFNILRSFETSLSMRPENYKK